ncbi:hypothetical protein ACFV1L_22070 [Kitasatospora sp. NPDC059646]|uniref:hypothetical protein n=1 Tax=Kitasatospora sp. NPDC059646 TaxID=3346893 RepID=UPI00367F3131
MLLHAIAYRAKAGNGISEGVALVPATGARPTWAECAAVVPDFLGAEILGKVVRPEPLYTLRYETESGRSEKLLNRARIEKHIGPVVMSCANRGTAWNVEVLDATGTDVTADFSCFS